MSCSLERTPQSTNNKSCIPCNTLDQAHLLEMQEVTNRVAAVLPLWTAETTKSDQGVQCHLSRKFTSKNFQAALDAINAIGAIAEAESHHPDLHLTNYREVEVELWTHKLNGVTENDILLAQKLDTVPVDYSPKWLNEHPKVKEFVKPRPDTVDG
jgi:pterin-4a-carbinolamine dehydratase